MPAFDHQGFKFSRKAASQIPAGAPVRLDTLPNQVVPVLATVGVELFGICETGAATVADQVTIYGEGNTMKVTAAGSFGAGADIGVATNGRYTFVTASSGTVKHRIGKSMTAGVDGESFSLYISPRQISGAA